MDNSSWVKIAALNFIYDERSSGYFAASVWSRHAEEVGGGGELDYGEAFT